MMAARDLRYYAELPVADEPLYKDGFYCDVCEKDFMRGPFYHSAHTGRDCCIGCAQALGLHSIPGLVCDLFTPMSPDWMLRCAKKCADEAFAVPLFCYIPEHTTLQVGLFLSNGNSLLVDVTDYSLESGAAYDHGSITRMSGDSLVKRYPWLPMWCDMERLTSTVRPTFSHAVMGERRDGNRQSSDVLVKAADQSDGCVVFRFTNGLSQMFDTVHGVEVVKHNSTLLRCRIHNQFVLPQKIHTLDLDIQNIISSFCC